ncbi:methylenetetrahydrofolate reductase [NAD(P)H] [Luteolibacter sp. SL250]|uniref:methylenetetrahydrofolate reductase [NAD(P)H] n=1 Tax=Luteolibacter sp. SL250 TaxID=2995170 RepID=UPI0022722713|nr:methylenetetrahydrofolate reductase [NAD(P)H] [Luteolibacter sp. SL250]WAC18706.1 methylenetetrahydrofolate reductase [NAD(P)H] [Luteolibacter sp. SL250]
MHIRDILAGDEPKFSFEFFPPKSAEAADNLFRSISELQPCDPAFVSVTYGAGGTTREATHGLVVRLQKDTALNTIPHLTCVGHSENDIAGILERYARAGVSNILALRGDPPKGSTGTPAGDFPYAADLVAFIRKFSEKHGHDFGIGVAGFPEGHPATPNRMLEMDHLKAKMDAGADYICTQLFFDNHDFYDFRDRCELARIKAPILAGIMPITSASGLNRMAELAAGARFPAKLLRSLSRAKGDEATVRRIGIHYATAQCSDLLDHGVKGIHFYTLNQSTATIGIFRSLGLRQPALT